jgi:hypothetical protein
MAMEGFVATWYSSIARKSLEEYRALARAIASRLQQRARVLDLALGPGYFAVELATLGPFCVTRLSRPQARSPLEAARLSQPMDRSMPGNATLVKDP